MHGMSISSQAAFSSNSGTRGTGDATTMTLEAHPGTDASAPATTTVNGNDTHKVDGNHKVTVGGNQATAITGKGEVTANQSYEIKVGASSIKIEPAKITIKSPQVEIDASLTFKAKGGLTAKVEGGLTGTFKGGLQAKLDGGLMTTVKGGVQVKIN